MKFGGSSLRNHARIKQVAKIIKSRLDRKPVVVVSAHGDVTDWLIKSAKNARSGQVEIKKIIHFHRRLAKSLGLSAEPLTYLFTALEKLFEPVRLSHELTPQLQDEIISYGERLSCRIVAGYLRQQGIPARAVDAPEIGLLTDSNFGSAVPLPGIEKKIAVRLKKISRSYCVLSVITGFIGQDLRGHLTTLGRNGSDYTAAIIGSAIGAKEIQLWSDVDGVMTANPKIVPEAELINRMSFNEAGELAYYGGRFHPSTLLPAIKKNIPVRILNILTPNTAGTCILKKCSVSGHIKSIVYKKNLYLINIISSRMLGYAGFLARIFDVFSRHKVVIDMIASSEVSVSVTTDRAWHLTRVMNELSE
ncbi:MAG: aspartate kinase, partial [Planctomycetota bacterium]